jgi:hypothetical protein
MIEEILKSNRRLRIEHKNILKEADAEGAQIFEVLTKYLCDYCEYFTLNALQTEQRYLNFVEDYISNFKTFNESNQYPYETGKVKTFDRVTYDIALILSVFFIPARYKMFRELLNLLKLQNGKILIIGVGAAIELELIYTLLPGKEVESYDLSISSFVKERFANKKIFEKEFIFDPLNLYQNILAIELLEHLSEPINFVKNCSQSLVHKGGMYITTASNMPQFDHLFNFHDIDFDTQLESIGLSIKTKLKLAHPLLNKNIESYNTFYHLIKN